MERCNRCHRVIRDPASIKRGFGPVCWTKVMETSAIPKAPTINGQPADEPEKSLVNAV